ncbi:heavy metal translocating P-type ATPase [Kovacikia minuta CCNUW1]|uniref:heavy metal translocating P-type ATPase n=1 Tax=Kovacikia minuta TaxID=2931930 RepID=UPI001CCED7E3|nr:heavy metal translocating P-type ATPase [Kovacikia minuta]UBF25738.1 heavy metal translocating P-type ATPase [Kovacikia minuta CCNUW1]
MQLIPKAETFSSVEPSEPKTIALDVTGMKCAGCVKAVENQLTQQAGVLSACVNLVTEVAVVECEPGVVKPEVLAESLTEAGFPTQPRYPQGKDPTSEGEPTEIIDLAARRKLESRQQVGRLAIAFLLLFLSALGHLGQLGGITVPGLSNIWFHCGLATLALLGPGRTMLIDGWRGLRRNAPNMNTLVSLGTLTAYTTSLVALLFPQLGWECFFDEPVMLVGFILLGRTLEQQARNRAAAAFHALLALQPKVARLIPVGIQDSGFRIQDSEARSQEPEEDTGTWGHGDAENSIHNSQFKIQNFIEIPADRVRIGEWLQVLPGDKIPVDGKVVAGQTTVDESMLTGESVPVLKQPGDFVAAGTLNQSGAIALQATRTGKDTTVAQIIALVEAAQTRKAPIQALADTVAGYFTYGVLAIATLTFLFWYFMGTHLYPEVLMDNGHWGMGNGHLMTHHLLSSYPTPHTLHPTPLLLSLKLAIAVLVVACPCALGLATPTAILVGSGIGAERGLLIRGGDVLEHVHQLDTLILDKTGTITTGKPVVTDCILIQNSKFKIQNSLPTPHLLQLAAAVESGTRHPLALAILQESQRLGLPLLPARDFVTEPGLGVAATVLPDLTSSTPPIRVVLGTWDWLTQNGIETDAEMKQQARQLAEAGKTVISVAIAGEVAGLIAVADVARPDAPATIQALQQMGLKVMLLTGDRQTVAQSLAQPLGIEPAHILAEVLPEGKAKTIAHLQAQGHRVAMVGDGINDAPALAQADVGLAFHSGTDVAVETAEIILMRDRLSDVVEAIRLSRAIFNKIRQNLFWAFAYNILGIPLAAGILLPSSGILLSPAAAGAMMAFSSVSVVTNSLLLYLTFTSPKQAEASGEAE